MKLRNVWSVQYKFNRSKEEHREAEKNWISARSVGRSFVDKIENTLLNFRLENSSFLQTQHGDYNYWPS